MADGRVAGGHVIEAVHDARACGPPAASAMAPRAISHITSSIASLPASRTYSRWGTWASRAGSSINAIEKAVVPFAVDETRPRPLQLVAHAARAPDLHVERLVVASMPGGCAWPSWKQRRPDGTG